MIWKTGMIAVTAATLCLFCNDQSNAQVISSGYSPRVSVIVPNVRPRNLGQPFNNGQTIRYGTRNAGVRFSAQDGFRAGTRRWGVQFGQGNGLQVGRLNRRW